MAPIFTRQSRLGDFMANMCSRPDEIEFSGGHVRTTFALQSVLTSYKTEKALFLSDNRCHHITIFQPSDTERCLTRLLSQVPLWKHGGGAPAPVQGHFYNDRHSFQIYTDPRRFNIASNALLTWSTKASSIFGSANAFGP